MTYLTKKTLESCICSVSKLVLAKELGNKYTYEEEGLVCTYYIYEGKYYLESVEEVECTQ